MKYEPRPMDTTGAHLSREILELTEMLARNAHDNWARQRLAEGWTYGPERNDVSKRHPCLVPYEELPESEKRVDRNAAMETLKAVLALGYRIEPPSTGPAIPSDDVCIDESVYLQRLRLSPALGLSELLEIWRIRSGSGRNNSPEFYQRLGERILRVGEPLLAYDVLQEGLRDENWPGDLRLRQLLALALARSGATHRANEMLLKLNGEGHADGETLGLLARTHKDLWAITDDAETGKPHLLEAHRNYSDAFNQAMKIENLDHGIYNGINAASTAMFLGRKDEAASLAQKVQELCLNRVKLGEDYWALASLGEAALILGRLSEAEERYLEAREAGKGHYADLSTTRRQARLLLDHLGMEKHLLDGCFRIPRVVVFAGHMIDRPGRAQPRFPESMEQVIYRAIVSRLGEADAGIGYSSAACGSDILFLEAMHERKAETNLIIPFMVEAFRKTSVDIIPWSNWGKRFDRVMEQAAQVVIASEHSSSESTIAYEYANRIQDGLAILRARALDTEAIPLVVWDGRLGDGQGGTASLVEHFRSQGREPEIIDVAALLQEERALEISSVRSEPTKPQTPEMGPAPHLPQETRAILFFDVKEYSKLKEEQIPSFVEYFMGTVNHVLEDFPEKPLARNTWGDALYCVFSTVHVAGRFALRLRDEISAVKWEDKGLPPDLNLRISLHAGPAFSFMDPVLKVQNYLGFHVSRAARIEPITPPGEVYASQQFAALAASEGLTEFTCEYVGQVPLPKKSGVVPLYLVRGKRI